MNRKHFILSLGCLLLGSLGYLMLYTLEKEHEPLSRTTSSSSINVDPFRRDEPPDLEPGEFKRNTSVSPVRPVLLVMVITAPEKIKRRNVIRATWIHSYEIRNKKFLVKFAIGTLNLSRDLHNELLEEHKKNNDIVFLEDHLESYHNLTRKVLRMLVWSHQNVNFTHLLKIDDDCFPRLDIIEKELKNRLSNKPLYWGSMAMKNKPVEEGKWMESNWDLGSTYLPYANGGGYLLSHELIANIVKNHKSLKLYNNEDVSVGVWVSPFIQERIDDKRFYMYNCSKRHLLTNIPGSVGIKRMYDIHFSLFNNGSLCIS